MLDQVTSTQITDLLTRTTQALELLAKNSEPKTKPHPLDDMSNEEVAIILVMRGKVKTQKDIAEALSVNERTVREWEKLRVMRDSLKRGEKLGRIRKGFNNGNGEIDGFS